MTTTVQHPAFESVTHVVDNPDEWVAQGWKVITPKAAEQVQHDVDPSVSVRPAGNASHEAWADYAARQPGFEGADIAEMSRDEIRDLFSE